MKHNKNVRSFGKFNEELNTPNINESKKLSYRELNSKIEKIVKSNIKEIPYEGTEVDEHGIRESILELVYELCPEYRPEGWGKPSPW